MTPKEKAVELVNNFTFRCEECDYDWNAKQCALIAVNEILNQLSLLELSPLGTYTNPKIEYWLEVKQEIEKL